MKIGVVTVTFNAALYLRPFLECCLAQAPGDFELLVIDNASSDTSVAIARVSGDARVTVVANDDNIGYAAACNQGIRYFAAKGIERILFINNDTEFDAHLFASLLEHLNRRRADAVTPRITHFDEPARDWYAGGRIVLWKGFQGAHLKSEGESTSTQAPSWTEVAPGCCVLFAMDTFRRVGLFDPTYFVYVEDTDLFLRMQRAGLRLLYVPGTTIAHKISLSTGGTQSDFSIRYHQRNQIYALRKHYRRSTVATQFVVLLIKATLRRMLGMDDSRQYRLRRQALREGLRLEIPSSEIRFDASVR
ncbi:MAG TPA: glycosyltransferase family 2 protein [Burkholderiaceae bacterium]